MKKTCLQKVMCRVMFAKISFNKLLRSSWTVEVTAPQQFLISRSDRYAKELTSFWKLAWLSNSLRWHFWDIDWHLFVVVEVMDCRCLAVQVWWRIRTPRSKTMQWPRRPSLWMLFVWLSKFFLLPLHFDLSKYQIFFFFFFYSFTYAIGDSSL